MRYSRFKKQMDGTATVRRPRGPNSPRKKVEKNKSPKKGKAKAKEEDEDEDDSQVKREPGMGSRQGTAESEAHSGVEGRVEKGVKLEPGRGLASASHTHSGSLPTPMTMPNTPSSSSRYVREASASPSPGPSERFEAGDIGEIDEMGFSFGMHGEEPMYGGVPLMGEGVGMGASFGGGFGMGMGMQMGLGDPFDGMWQGHSGHGGNGGSVMHGGEGVHVKTEPRWEEAYRHT